YSAQILGNQGRPGRIGSIQGRDNFALIVSSEIDTVDARATILVLPEIRKYPAIGRPGRTFDQEAFRQQPFARAVFLHHADIEAVFIAASEGNEIAAWRPYGRVVAAFAEADPLNAAAIGAHLVDLRRSAPIGIEHYFARIRRKRWRSVNRGIIGQTLGAA